MVDFKKLSDPEWIKQWEKEKRERERLYEENEALRQKTACFTGHRPDKLGGYDMKNPTMLKLKDKLLEVIEDLITRENKSRFISGGALGTDIAAFWCVHMLKKKHPFIEKTLSRFHSGIKIRFGQMNRSIGIRECLSRLMKS